MTPQEQRGKRLFLVLATLIVLEKLAGIVLALSGGLAEVNWLKSVAQPIAFAGAVVYLWQGEVWLRWLVGIAYVFSGSVLVYVSARLFRIFAEEMPPKSSSLMQVVGYPIRFVGLFGLLNVIAGLLFLFSPSMRAFFRYQREVRMYE